MNTLLILLDNDSMTTLGRTAIENYIRQQNSWAKLFDAAWFISTSEKTADVRNSLRALSSGARITIINVSGSGWATSFSNEVTTWMKNNI